MPPLQPEYHYLFPRDPPAPSDNNNQVSVSPSLIVGICILGAIFLCILLASVTRLCSRTTGPEVTENLFKPQNPSQIERLQEVRRINNKMAWERGHWARAELVRQGRRLTGYGLGNEEGERCSWGEHQDGYEVARNSLHPSPLLHPHPHQHTHFTHRESHLLPDNPYAHLFRASKLLRATRTRHNADQSDDEDDEVELDMDAFPCPRGLADHLRRSQERLSRTPGSDESKSSSNKTKGKEAVRYQRRQVRYQDSQAYLGPAIVTTSTGLDERNGQRGSTQLQHMQPHIRDLTPDPSPTQSTRLMYGNAADLETINLDDQTTSQTANDPTSPIDSVRSNSTIKANPRPVSYQEDYAPNTITSLGTIVRSALDQEPDESWAHHDSRPINSNPGTPTIMINDDPSECPVPGPRRAYSENSNTYPLVNVGTEAGAEDINEIRGWEEGEEGRVSGRYWNAGRAGRGWALENGRVESGERM